MLIFATKLYVKESLTDEIFIEMAVEWVSGGNNYTFEKIVWDGSEEYSVENFNKTQQFSIMKYDDAVIIHLVNKDGKIIWTNDFVLTYKEGRRILAVQLYNEAEDMSVKLPKNFNRPRLLKKIIANDFGAEDNGLAINGKPLYIDEMNIQIIENVILKRNKYMMPVVYIASNFFENKFEVDFNELAKDLAGVAHVLVETSRQVAKKLKEVTDGRNPYNGAVQIFYSHDGSQRILPDYYDNKNKFRNEIAYSVFSKLILGKIDDEFSWTKIRYNNLLKKSRDSMEIEAICDELLAEKDSIIKQNNQRINELEELNNLFRNKLLVYENRLKKDNSISDQIVALNIQEVDLYENEIKDVLLKTIESVLHNMDMDLNQMESRKYHILKSIKLQNHVTNVAEDIVEELKSILNKDGSFNSAKRKRLIDLGFEIKEGKHYKLTYKGDDRYMITLAKTSSDYRSNMNMVSKATKKIFGY